MPELVLDDGQTRLVADSVGPIEVRDASGRRIGVLHPQARIPLSVAELDRVRERMADPDPQWLTTDELIERVRARAGE